MVEIIERYMLRIVIVSAAGQTPHRQIQEAVAFQIKAEQSCDTSLRFFYSKKSITPELLLKFDSKFT